MSSNLQKVVTKQMINDCISTFSEMLFQVCPQFEFAKKAVTGYITIKADVFLVNWSKFIDATAQVGDQQELMQKFNDLSEENKYKITESIFNILLKAESMEKIEIYAMLFKVSVLRRISETETLRLFKIVDRAMKEDLEKLKDFQDSHVDNSDAGRELQNLGLLYTTGIDAGEFDNPNSGGYIYEYTNIGKKLVSILEPSEASPEAQ